MVTKNVVRQSVEAEESYKKAKPDISNMLNCIEGETLTDKPIRQGSR